ncbi:MAG: Methyltransferase [Ignavibacteria bacterium]|nr:Methyltransferase [Ignavibacteria bacterium]
MKYEMNLFDKNNIEKAIKANSSINKKELFYILLNSNLDFGKENNVISRHGWHSFPAKFPPALPKLFIENLTQINDVILDPMSGSCTTLLESVYLNRKGYGFDIDPLSLMIGKAKLQNINKLEIKEIGNSILNRAYKVFIYNKNDLEKELVSRFDKETFDFLNFWYSKESQLELISLILQIEKIENQKAKEFLQLIFSSIIITKSGGVTLSYDLAHTRPHKVKNKTINSAFIEFNKKITKILNNGYIDLPENFELNEGNAKQLSLPDNSVDLIVTSPPYANNAIDYMRAHKFSLIWFNFSINELKNTRKKFIGAESLIKGNIKQLPELTCSIVSNFKKINISKGNSVERYYSEIQQVISEMYRVLKPQRACVIVVASSILNGIDIRIDKCFKELGEHAGFELVHIGERNIQRDKRMMPISRNSIKLQIENRMHKEFVIGFWK